MLPRDAMMLTRNEWQACLLTPKLGKPTDDIKSHPSNLPAVEGKQAGLVSLHNERQCLTSEDIVENVQGPFSFERVLPDDDRDIQPKVRSMTRSSTPARPPDWCQVE